MKRASDALAIVLALGLGACGQSSEDKAKSTVCDARADIGKQVDELKSLTPTTVTKDAANKAFTSSVQATASQAVNSLSASDAKAALVTALQQLEASYQKTFAPLNCD